MFNKYIVKYCGMIVRIIVAITLILLASSTFTRKEHLLESGEETLSVRLSYGDRIFALTPKELRLYQADDLIYVVKQTFPDAKSFDINKDNSILVVEKEEEIDIYKNHGRQFSLVQSFPLGSLSAYELYENSLWTVEKNIQANSSIVRYYLWKDQKFIEEFENTENGIIQKIQGCPNSASIRVFSSQLVRKDQNSTEGQTLIFPENSFGPKISEDCQVIAFLNKESHSLLNVYSSKDFVKTQLKTDQKISAVFFALSRKLIVEMANEIIIYNQNDLEESERIFKLGKEKIESVFENSMLFIEEGDEIQSLIIVSQEEDETENGSSENMRSKTQSTMSLSFPLLSSTKKSQLVFGEQTQFPSSPGYYTLYFEGNYLIVQDYPEFSLYHQINGQFELIQNFQGKFHDFTPEKQRIISREDDLIKIFTDKGMGYSLQQEISPPSEDMNFGALDTTDTFLVIFYNFPSTQTVSKGFLVLVYEENEGIFSRKVSEFEVTGLQGSDVKFCGSDLLIFSETKKFIIYEKIQGIFSQKQIINTQYYSRKLWRNNKNNECTTIIGNSFFTSSVSGDAIYVLKKKSKSIEISDIIELPFPSSLKVVSVSSDGNMFSVGGYSNVKVYQDTQENGQFELVASFPAKRLGNSVVITNSYLVYTFQNGVTMRKFTKSEHSYGLKENFLFYSQSELLNQQREINSISISWHRLFASSLYEGSFLYQYSEQTQDHQIQTNQSQQNIFISDIDMESRINRMVAGTYNNGAVIFQDHRNSLGQLREYALPTTSQVMKVDLNKELQLVLGLMNGDLLVYSMTWPQYQQNYTLHHTINNQGGQIYGVKVCDDGTVLALVETAGAFSFEQYSSAGEPEGSIQLAELVGVHLEADDQCSTVAIGCLFLMKVMILQRQSGGQFIQWKEVGVDSPVGQVALSPDADVLFVPKLTQPVTSVYRYSLCQDDFQLVHQLQSKADPTVVSADGQYVAVGEISGRIQSYFYEWTFGAECSGFGKKNPIEIAENSMSIDDMEREVIKMKVYVDLLLVASKFDKARLYERTADAFTLKTAFNETIFVSDFDFDLSSGVTVVGSYDMNAYAYWRNDEGAISLNATVETASQVTSVDLNAQAQLVLGHKNGDISVHQRSDSGAWTSAEPVSHEGGEVYAVKSCEDGSVLAVVEVGGSFSFHSYSASQQLLQTEPVDQLIEPYFAATDDCQVVAIGGIMMLGFSVYNKADDGQYAVQQEVSDEGILSGLSINPDGDVILVSRYSDAVASVYQFNPCTEEYEIPSDGTHTHIDPRDGSAAAIDGLQLALGFSSGSIEVSDYQWQYLASCSSSDSSWSPLTTADVSSFLSQPNQSNQPSQPRDKLSSKKAQVLSDQDSLNVGEIVLISALIFLAIATILICARKWTKQIPSSESCKELESIKESASSLENPQN